MIYIIGKNIAGKGRSEVNANRVIIRVSFASACKWSNRFKASVADIKSFSISREDNAVWVLK